MFERFTRPAREVVTGAVAEAERLGHPSVATEHLLLALTGEGDDIGRSVLRQAGVTREAVEREVRAAAERGGLTEDDASALRTLGIDLDEVRRQVEAAFGPGALLRPRSPERRGRSGRGQQTDHCRRPFTAATKKVLEVSLREAVALKHNYIGTEHVLLALVRVRDGDLGSGVLGDLAQSNGVPLDELRSRVMGAVRRAS